MTVARISLARVELKRPRLSELQIGQECDITFTALKVDARGFCYLLASERVASEDNYSTIHVRRDDVGYHVTAARRGTPLTFMRKASFWTYPFQKYYPVASFKETE